MKEGVDFFSETIILLLYLNSDITVKMLETKHNDICKELEARIKKGVYPEKLPGVHKLAKDLKASHITVSKALKELASQGLVTIINRKRFSTMPVQFSRLAKISHPVLFLAEGVIRMMAGKIPQTIISMITNQTPYGPSSKKLIKVSPARGITPYIQPR